jgi:Domain of unknown function (DUF4345)
LLSAGAFVQRVLVRQHSGLPHFLSKLTELIAMIDRRAERRFLQVAVAFGCFVPILGGMLGIITGSGIAGSIGSVTLDSHVRYLSGLLLAIGLAFAVTIPEIETHSSRIALLSTIVIIGGLARLYGIFADGWPDAPMRYALIMELGVVPLLWLWQRRLARLYR